MRTSLVPAAFLLPMLLAPAYTAESADSAAGDSAEDSGRISLPEPEMVASNPLDDPDYFANAGDPTQADDSRGRATRDGRLLRRVHAASRYRRAS